MADITNTADIIDVRDVIERVEELETELEEAHEAGQFMSGFDDWILDSRDNSDPIYAAFGDEGHDVQSGIEEFYKLRELLDDLAGNGGNHEWRNAWYPVTLIRDSYFEDYAREFAEDTDAVPKHMPWPGNFIDWKAAAEALQMDYTAVDYDYETYWYR